MIDMMDKAAMRDRFAQLGALRDAALAISGPLREQRDGIVAEAAGQVQALDGQIATAEDGLFEVDQERALIARALGGRTSE